MLDVSPTGMPPLPADIPPIATPLAGTASSSANADEHTGSSQPAFGQDQGQSLRDNIGGGKADELDNEARAQMPDDADDGEEDEEDDADDADDDEDQEEDDGAIIADADAFEFEDLPAPVAVKRRSKTHAERLAAKGKKSGMPHRLQGPALEYLLALVPEYMRVDKRKGSRGKTKRLGVFWKRVQDGFWERFDWQDFRAEFKQQEKTAVHDAVNDVRYLSMSRKLYSPRPHSISNASFETRTESSAQANRIHGQVCSQSSVPAAPLRRRSQPGSSGAQTCAR